jgi:hypothetical protein
VNALIEWTKPSTVFIQRQLQIRAGILPFFCSKLFIISFRLP